MSPDNTVELILAYIVTYFTDYPLDEPTDRIYFKILQNDFADSDIVEEFKTFHAWIMDTQKPPHIRSRFRKWLKNSKNWTSKYN